MVITALLASNVSDALRTHVTRQHAQTKELHVFQSIVEDVITNFTTITEILTKNVQMVKLKCCLLIAKFHVNIHYYIALFAIVYSTITMSTITLETEVTSTTTPPQKRGKAIN